MPFNVHTTEKNKASTVLQRQECIPVGCVPPASVAISGGGVSVGGRCLSKGGLPRVVCLGDVPKGGVCLGDGCLGEVSAQGGVCPEGCLPREGISA